ncbi:MAG: hypothetical protein J6Q51_00975 [Clostridia bacterium]|nr:hypothetical protein [Clostridia bacterium]
MTTKQVLENVAVFLGKEELLDCAYFTNTNEEIPEDIQKDLNLMLRCLNFIVNEIATDYLPVLKQKSVMFVDNCLDIKEVDTNIYKIIKIENKNGEVVKFNYTNGCIKSKVTEAIITYSSFPEKADLNGEVENFNNMMTDRVLAYGTAMEYSFVNSLYDDATVWESRYKNALLVLSQKKHNLIMPKRRWL